jgi:glycolate oxidase
MNDASASQPLQGIDHVREQFHNLHEFVAVARAKLDRNVWDYLIGGAETETTVRRNRGTEIGAACGQLADWYRLQACGAR